MTGDSDRGESARSEQRRLLRELLERGGAGSVAQALSNAQQRLWFLDRLGAGAAYNVRSAWRLRGPLDVDALARSLDAVVDRHEVLRASFPSIQGRPVQVIAPAIEVPLAVRDLSGLPADERSVELRRCADEEAERSFDLARSPLLRAHLFKCDEAEHYLVVIIHHIVADGWSLDVVWRELSTLYEGFSCGEPPSLPELAIQYGEFALWQRRLLESGAARQQLSYWTQQLGDASPLDLPTDHPRPPIQTFRGGTQSVQISQSCATSLAALGRRENASLFMVLLAAFQVLLGRYARQDDVVIGSPVANRSRREFEDLVGFCLNTLVLRTDLSGRPTFREFLTRVRRTALDAYRHQDVPFEQLVQELEAERQTDRSPLFQVGFTVLERSADGLKLRGLEVSRVELVGDPIHFDIVVIVEPRDGALEARFRFNADLFDAETIERMSSHYGRLIEAIVADPDQRITSLPKLTELERDQILVDWNDTAATYPDDRRLHELFEEQVARTPDAVAAIFGEETLTYAALNAQANRLAHYLQARGVGPEQPVGLCVERSFEMVIGILGVLKAGGAYLPLDPDYPAARLAFMLNDARPPVLLTLDHLRSRLPVYDGVVIALDHDWTEIEREPTTQPPSDATSRSLAWVIYTSGSTGQPKGACVEHRGVVSLAYEQARAFGVDGDSRVLQFSSLSFDASAFEIVMALTHGATLVLGDRASLLPGADLVEFLRENRVSIITMPPTALAALPFESLPDLQTITVAGEACPDDLVNRWASGRRFFNLYGPTEATIWSTMAELRPGDTAHIGRPIGNVRLYVMDAFGQPVPVGIPGELWIGGIGLARGYLNRPALTAERFVPDPFGGEAGARLYRTGDLVRYGPDGAIEFLGRIDEQVKLRGYRIELGEIESMLMQHPSVDQAVASVRSDRPGDERLVAYVVPKGDASPVTAEVQEFLRTRLPAYMVPSVVVQLESLPLTPNGKVDRKALPAPDLLDHSSAYVGPRSPIEEIICAIWSEVLMLDRVGVNDDFFALGGHSLKASQLASRMGDELGVKIALGTLLESSTVAAMAEYADALITMRDGSGTDASTDREEFAL